MGIADAMTEVRRLYRERIDGIVAELAPAWQRGPEPQEDERIVRGRLFEGECWRRMPRSEDAVRVVIAASPQAEKQLIQVDVLPWTLREGARVCVALDVATRLGLAWVLDFYGEEMPPIGAGRAA